MTPKEQYTALEKLVKHYLVKYYYKKNGQDLLVEDFLPLCGAILVPFLNIEINDENKEISIKGIIESLKKHTKRLKLEEYTFESVIDILKEKWMGVLSTQEQKKLLRGISLVVKVENNGVFSIKDKPILLKNTLEMSNGILGEYGVRTIQRNTPEIIAEAVIEENSLDVENNTNNNLEAIEEVSPEKASNKENSSGKLTDEKHESLKNNLIRIYDELAKNREFGDLKPQYIWQWKLSQKEYEEIKGILESDGSKKGIKKVYKTNNKCLTIIVSYIAEHYKREWNGRDENRDSDVEEKFLKCIGLDGHAKKIAIAYFGEKSGKIYSADKNKRWLDSLRVEGGLPIRYICNQANNNSNQINNGITQLVDGIYNQNDSEIEDQLNNLNNVALRNSYSSGHSIYSYIETLLSDKFHGICNEKDKDIKLFSDFSTILEEGIQRNQKKFDIKYDVWKSATSFNINRSLVMKVCSGIDEDIEYIISKKRLPSLDTPYTFDLKYRMGNWEKKQCFVPYKCNFKNEITHYRADDNRAEMKLPSLTAENSNQKIEILYLTQNEEQKFDDANCFPKVGYKEFRKEAACEWRDKSYSRESSPCAAVLYKTDIWSVDEIYNPIEVDGLDGFAWVEFDERVTLTSQKDNKKKVLYNAIDKFFVEPKETSYHPITNLTYIKTEDKKVDVIIGVNDEEERQVKKVFLLKEPVEFIAKNIENDNEIEKNDILVEYKTLNETNYKPYKESANLSGYVKFRIKIRNSHFIVESCILPECANITRHCPSDNGTIQFKKFGVKIKTKTINDNIATNFEEDYKKVEINLNEECILKIKVARPFNKQDLFKRGVRDEMNDAIPIRFAELYEVRTFNDDGVSRKKIKDVISWQELMQKLKQNSKKDIIVDGLRFQAYTKKIEQRENIGYYVDSGKSIDSENLRFRFLSLDNNTLQELTLKEKIVREGGSNKSYLVLDLPQDRNSDGIILQSLYDTNGYRLYPKRYYRPIFLSKKNNESVSDEDKKIRRYKRYCRYCKEYSTHAENNIIYQHFDIVCECSCYFGSMDILCALTHEPSCLISKKCSVDVGSDCEVKIDNKKDFQLKELRLAKFYLGYVKYCKEKNKEPNYKELWRMADEFGFDWLIIPRSVWLGSISKEDKDTEKKSIIKLFMYRPNGVYKGLLDEYWGLNWEAKKGKSSIAYGFMKYILDGTVQYINYKNGCKKCDIPSMPTTEELSNEIDRLKNR